MTLVVVDQGSSATKACRVAGDGTLAEPVRVAVDARREGDRVEQDPEELLESVRRALGALRSEGPIDAIGLCCQRSTCLLWDRESGAPRSPALSWQDRRTAGALERWADEDREEVARRSGLRLSPHYAGSKLAWLLDSTEGARRAAESGALVAGTLDAFLVRGLTGRESTEPGHAGRTLLYDLERDGWSGRLAEAFDIPVAALPPIEPSLGERGRWEGIPVRALLGDQQAALLGHGEPAPGRAVAHFGTGAFVLVSTGERIRRHSGLLSAVTFSSGERRELQIEGSVNSAGSALSWMADRLGIDLAELAPEAIDLDRVPWCVPAFGGLGAPWWVPGARAALLGLRDDQTGEDLIAGVLAGVVFRVVDNLEALAETVPALDTVRIGGPLTRVPALGRLLADASGLTVEAVAEEEAGLAGLARLLGAPVELAVARRWSPSWSAQRRRTVRVAWVEAVRSTAARGFLDPPGSHTL